MNLLSDINTKNNGKLDDFLNKIDELTYTKSVETKFVVYPEIFEISINKTIDLPEGINAIKNRCEVFEKKYKHKIELPVIYFSVTGFNGRKKNVNAISHSGYIVIDIDVKDNPDTDFKKLKTCLKQDIYTHACFSSPSGGLKVVFKTNIKDKSLHGAYFHAIVDYLLKNHSLINEIDGSGRNIARACFMPHDPDAYLNPDADIFNVCEEELEKITSELKSKKRVNEHFESLLTLEDITDDVHYQNIKNLFMARTGLKFNDEGNGDGTDVPSMVTSVPPNRTDVTPNGTSVTPDRTDVPSINEFDCEWTGVTPNGTDVTPLSKNNNKTDVTPIATDVTPIKDVDCEWTSVLIYDILYNKYRYKLIIYIMSTPVHFFDLLYQMNSHPYHVNGNPYRLDFTTHIDEKYFNGDTTKPISVDHHPDLEPIEYCEISLSPIPMGKRGKKLSAFATKLFFNNPFCHPQHIYECLKTINERYCEDPEPVKNPKPDDREIRNIVMYYYELFITNELDFSKQLRKKDKNKDELRKKHVFTSRYYRAEDKKQKHMEAIKVFHDGSNHKKIMEYRQAVEVLQDGSKITNKRVAEYLGVSARTISRLNKDKVEKTADIQAIIKEYNNSISTGNMGEPCINSISTRSTCGLNQGYNLSKETNSNCELSKASNPANVTGIKDVINEAPVDEPNINPANNNSDGDSSYENRSVDPFALPQQPLEDTATATIEDLDDDFDINVFNDDEVIKPNTGFDKPESNIEPRQVFNLFYANILSKIGDDEKKQAYQRFKSCYNNLSDEEKKILEMKDEEIDKNRLEVKKDLQNKLHWSTFPILV